MKKILVILAMGCLIISCGEKKEAKAESASDEVPIDLNNKGVGPITAVEFGAEIDTEMAAKGENTFSTICVACHMAEQRMIGPALKGIYERRSPEWVMNMILNPDGMLKEDPIAKALLKEYNNTIMLNQNLSEEQARSVAEYLRTL